ncbi:MAG TPA: hypothetical protein VN665_03555 [Candidatus Paceibacterota bacterium]|nr:hypothetical protein [Candidatus Paceibacterota bacterium]
MTDQEKQQTKVELKALLDALTSADASGAAIGTELEALEKGTEALEGEVAAAQTDIDTIVEEGGKQLDALIAAEQQEA